MAHRTAERTTRQATDRPTDRPLDCPTDRPTDRLTGRERPGDTNSPLPAARRAAPRSRGGGTLRALLALLVTASVAVPVSGFARSSTPPAPAPARPAPLRDATPAALAGRYAGTRHDIRAAERTAAAHGDSTRAAALRAMAGGSRHFLLFDGRDGGRSAEVYGRLAGARRIAVLVPGSGTGLDTYGRLRRGAQALSRQLGPGSAVVAWLGYPPPAALSAAAATTGRADAAAPRLDGFVRSLTATVPGARVSVLCHSYGTVVCGRAAAGLNVSDLVLYGSPGTGSPDAAALGTTATVWAGRASGDWIARVPHIRLDLGLTTIGFGTDPVSPRFGAHVFAAGTGGHGDYLDPGTTSLRALARIVRGGIPASGDGRA